MDTLLAPESPLEWPHVEILVQQMHLSSPHEMPDIYEAAVQYKLNAIHDSGNIQKGNGMAARFRAQAQSPPQTRYDEQHEKGTHGGQISRGGSEMSYGFSDHHDDSGDEHNEQQQQQSAQSRAGSDASGQWGFQPSPVQSSTLAAPPAYPHEGVEVATANAHQPGQPAYIAARTLDAARRATEQQQAQAQEQQQAREQHQHLQQQRDQQEREQLQQLVRQQQEEYESQQQIQQQQIQQQQIQQQQIQQQQIQQQQQQKEAAAAAATLEVERRREKEQRRLKQQQIEQQQVAQANRASVALQQQQQQLGSTAAPAVTDAGAAAAAAAVAATTMYPHANIRDLPPSQEAARKEVSGGGTVTSPSSNPYVDIPDVQDFTSAGNHAAHAIHATNAVTASGATAGHSAPPSYGQLQGSWSAAEVPSFSHANHSTDGHQYEQQQHHQHHHHQQQQQQQQQQPPHQHQQHPQHQHQHQHQQPSPTSIPNIRPVYHKCPIMKELIVDPVVAADGVSYERKAIETWLLTHTTSPVYKTPLADATLTDNLKLRQEIWSWTSTTAATASPSLVASPGESPSTHPAAAGQSKAEAAKAARAAQAKQEAEAAAKAAAAQAQAKAAALAAARPALPGWTAEYADKERKVFYSRPRNATHPKAAASTYAEMEGVVQKEKEEAAAAELEALRRAVAAAEAKAHADVQASPSIAVAAL